MADRPRLHELGERLGILSVYTDIQGVERFTEDATRERLLLAMGWDASTEASAEAALESLRGEEAARACAPVHVVHRQSGGGTIPLKHPKRWAGPFEWHAEFAVEGGGALNREGRFDPASGCALTLDIPQELEEGYHQLELTLECNAERVTDRQLLVVAPSRCFSICERVGQGRAYGIWTNLYSIRSRQNWGIGDVGDLETLSREAGRHGADFIGLNPLHATSNTMPGISPYSPVSRLFRNPVYIDVEAVPELAGLSDAPELLRSSGLREELQGLRAATRIDYERIFKLKRTVLQVLHRAFVAREAKGATSRGLAYRAYLAQRGQPLIDYATYMAMCEQRRAGRSGEPSADLPPPGSAAVAEFRQSHSHNVGFHCYLQFELDRQLADAHAAAKDAGMRLGLYHDLALGCVSDGSDVWACPDLFAKRVEVGAPPDAYSEVGQKWGFPPVNPHRLRERAFDYWIGILRASLMQAGMLRLDHVMGLFRQFWVPSEGNALQGAYVRYPSEELLRILALESQRHQAVIVGEDLGTVAPEVRTAMERYDIIPTRLLLFERNSDESFRAPHEYQAGSLVMAANHDYAPLAGLWNCRDVHIRRTSALLTDEQSHAEQEARQRMREALLHVIREAGLNVDAPEISPQLLCESVYSFLAQTPCRLLAISLDDLAEEEEPVNLPGVPVSRYPNWTRRMGGMLSEIVESMTFRNTLDTARRQFPRRD